MYDQKIIPIYFTLIPSTKLETCSSFHRVRSTPIRIDEPSKSSENDTSDSAACVRVSCVEQSVSCDVIKC